MTNKRNVFMIRKAIIVFLSVCRCVVVDAQVYNFNFSGAKKASDGVVNITSDNVYGDGAMYGYDFSSSWNGISANPFYFSVKVPDGNYRVTVEIGSNKRAAKTMIKAEHRRLYLEETETAKGKTKTIAFTVNKRSTKYMYEADGQQLEGEVKIKPREFDYLTWDDRLTLEFNGAAPAVKSIKIEPDTNATTIFLCGNSTVVDQGADPYASWGQMIPRWFGPEVCISNNAESGLTARTFLASNRLEKILSMMKPGDYVICEFGHNDEKERRPGDGAWYHYVYNLKIFIDKVHANGGNVIFCTPTQRRMFNDSKTRIVPTHGDFPAAMMSVAERENVPVIDLNGMTNTFFETLGFEDSKRSLVHYPANTFPGQDKKLEDNTHFNPYGAYEISKMVVMGLKRIEPPFMRHLSPDFKDYSPSTPDSFDVLNWYSSATPDVTKPDGN